MSSTLVKGGKQPAAKGRRAAAPQEVVAGPVEDKPLRSDIIQRELEAIAAKNNGLLPAKAVVEWARKNPRSELHKRFTWDDTEAAEKFRLWEARSIIARVTIEPRENVEVRAWVNLPSDRVGDEPAYRATVRVMSDADMRAELLASVKVELGRLRNKHADLTELASVWHEIDRVSESR